VSRRNPQQLKLTVCTPLLVVLITTFVLWRHNRILPKSQKSNFESLLSGKQTPGKHLSYREFVTPPTIQRPTASIRRELAIEYVFVPTSTGTFDLIVSPDSTEPYNGGWAGFILVCDADLRIRLVQRGEHDIEHELIFSSHNKGYVFHDSRGFEGGGADELNTVQDFVRRKSGERRLKDRLHAIWFVPLFIYNCRFTRLCFPGTAFRWTVPGHR
jgi:hypothetical protein